jgi:predicted alpha/beta superfamily hydrolase
MFTIQSSIVNDSYLIDLMLPDDYEQNPEQRYRTVYVLDANWHMEDAVRITRSLINRSKVEPVIIVGISAVQAAQSDYTGKCFIRCRDLTPTVSKRYPGSGGAPRFAVFIAKELIPYIDKHFRTIPESESRCLVGHSFGGLFTLYMLFHHNEVIQKYMVFSPTLFWDSGIVKKYEMEYAQNNSRLESMLYMTFGGREFRNRRLFRKMIKVLLERHYTGLRVISETISGANHYQVWSPSYENGLKWVWPNNRMIKKDVSNESC